MYFVLIVSKLYPQIKTMLKSKKYIFPILLLLIIYISNDANAQSIEKQPHENFPKILKKQIYLISGMNFNKQLLLLNDYSSRFNYDLSDYQNNLYKPAYFLGVGWESKSVNNHKYAFNVILSKVAAGNNYKDANKLTPFVPNFTKFLAEDQFLMLNVATYFKQLIPISDTSRYRLYLTIGPSLNIRLSDQSDANLINGNYKNYYVSGDGGLEFNNQSLYTLFVHYKYALNSFTKQPLLSNLNSVELGAMVKISDLF